MMQRGRCAQRSCRHHCPKAQLLLLLQAHLCVHDEGHMLQEQTSSERVLLTAGLQMGAWSHDVRAAA